jgi:hypothetical protein
MQELTRKKLTGAVNGSYDQRKLERASKAESWQQIGRVEELRLDLSRRLLQLQQPNVIDEHAPAGRRRAGARRAYETP